MRRVIDDKHYEEVKEKIVDALEGIDAGEVSRYSNGCWRASVSMIREEIQRVTDIKYGKNEHAHGIGNNNALELIVEDNGEEQICGLLHLTDDMFGGVYCWVSDIDGKRSSRHGRIRGFDSSSSYDRCYKNRYIVWE